MHTFGPRPFQVSRSTKKHCYTKINDSFTKGTFFFHSHLSFITYNLHIQKFTISLAWLAFLSSYALAKLVETASQYDTFPRFYFTITDWTLKCLNIVHDHLLISVQVLLVV